MMPPTVGDADLAARSSDSQSEAQESHGNMFLRSAVWPSTFSFWPVSSTWV